VDTLTAFAAAGRAAALKAGGNRVKPSVLNKYSTDDGAASLANGPSQKRCISLDLAQASCSPRSGGCGRADGAAARRGGERSGVGSRNCNRRVASFDGGDLVECRERKEVQALSISELTYLFHVSPTVSVGSDEGLFFSDNLCKDLQDETKEDLCLMAPQQQAVETMTWWRTADDSELRRACLHVVTDVMRPAPDVLDEALGDLPDTAEGVLQAGRHGKQAMEFHLQGSFRVHGVSRMPRNSGCLCLSSLQ